MRRAAQQGVLLAGQEIVMIGIRLDRPTVAAALESALLTDTELAAGPRSWANDADPLPSWGITHTHQS